MRHFTLMLALALGSAQPALALDLPYGADALPRLVTKADPIVTAQNAKFVRTTEQAPRLGVYSVQVATVHLAPKVKPGNNIHVLVPKGLPLTESMFTDAMLFLARPRGAGVAEIPTFELLGGGDGIIQKEQGERRRAVLNYLETKNVDQKLDWATKHVKSEEQFLQRSAVYQAAESAPKNQKAFTLLKDSLHDDNALAISTKVLAVQGLRTVNTKEATAVLADTCKSAKTHDTVRKEAMRSMVGMPDGIGYLEKWSAQDGSALAKDARKILTQHQLKGKAPEFAPAEVDKRLKAAVVAFAAENNKGLSEKLAAVEKVAALNNREAAEALKKIANDNTQPMLVRSNAILGIGRMESGVGGTILRDLSKTLADANLQRLAKGLAAE